ncbi:MAG: maleylpyruvate isomerase N-terminal domain-containing protein, partial [Actinobacteria bacterium]|nr:maleylpyruvate isomerase N-terminal domain-containing protein [Actinomycetota bacterium]
MRPGEGVWSALEYAAHSRDITALHAAGVEMAWTGDEPVFPAFADDAVDAAAAGYAELEPGEVLDALDEAANRLAGAAEVAGPDAWTRGLTIGDTRNDVRRMLEHSLHDSVHHLDDVERGWPSCAASRGKDYHRDTSVRYAALNSTRGARCTSEWLCSSRGLRRVPTRRSTATTSRWPT